MLHTLNETNKPKNYGENKFKSKVRGLTMEKKYKLTEESINFFGITLYRIEALKDFGYIKKGDKGGYVESEANLSQEDNCWISDDAKICGNARVLDNARVCGNALVDGNALIHGNALISNNARIHNNVRVYGNAIIYGNAFIYGDAQIYGNAEVRGNAWVHSDAKIYDNATVTDNVKICGDARICKNAKIYGNAIICGNALVKNNFDYIVFKNWWSSGRYFTWTRSNNMWRVGCFYGTGEQLLEKAYHDNEISGREYKRVVDYVESILKDNR